MIAHASSSLRRRKLLAVDDLPDNLFLMRAILNEDSGYELECAESGQAALESIESSPPDLILLDVMMPGMTGYEVARKVRQNPAMTRVPILFITAQEEFNKEEAAATGAEGFIRKPFDINHLVEQVEAILRKAEKAQSMQPSFNS